MQQKINWIIYVFSSALGLLLIGVVWLHWRMPRGDQGGFANVAMMVVFAVFSFCAVSFAQTAPKITGIQPNFVGQGRDGSGDEHPFIDITMTCSSACGEVNKIEFSTAGLTVVDDTIKASGRNRVAAKLAVAKDATPGFSIPTLTRKDGTKLDAAEGIYLEVFTEEGATVIARLNDRIQRLSAADPVARVAIRALASTILYGKALREGKECDVVTDKGKDCAVINKEIDAAVRGFFAKPDPKFFVGLLREGTGQILAEADRRVRPVVGEELKPYQDNLTTAIGSLQAAKSDFDRKVEGLEGRMTSTEDSLAKGHQKIDVLRDLTDSLAAGYEVKDTGFFGRERRGPRLSTNERLQFIESLKEIGK